MLKLDITSNAREIRKMLLEYRPQVIERATVSTLNKVATSARSKAVTFVRKKIKNMKAARIKQRISIIKATRGRRIATIEGKRVKIPPGAFTIPGHGDKLYVHVGKKHRNIIAKSGRMVGKTISSGYQIAPVQSVQVQREFEKKETYDLMVRVVNERFPKVFARDLIYYGNKYK